MQDRRVVASRSDARRQDPSLRWQRNSHLAFQSLFLNLKHGRNISRRTALRSRAKFAGKRGGQSLYFRDPDGNLLELATPGLWATY